MPKLHSALFTILVAASAMASSPPAAHAQTCACGAVGAVGVVAEEPPPPLPEYDQPPPPEAGYLWTPGYWYWNNVDYYWVPGTWVEPPRRGLLWTPGYWAFADGVYGFHRGYWGARVGFYGGVDYGYGYGGSGYQGGRWRDGAFFYNREANNLVNVHITNIYNEKVVVIASGNRASFNGGAGGVAAKPTAEELVAASEPHEKPTSAQIEHTRAASLNSGSFVHENKGKPPVAATPRAGALADPGVSRAKTAATPATPVSETKPKDEAAPAGEPAKAVEKPAVKTEPEPRPATKLKEDAKPEGKPETERKPKPKPELEPAAKAPVEPKVERKPTPESEPALKAPVEPKVERKPKLEPEPASRAPVEPKAKPAREAEPKARLEPQRSEPKPEPREGKKECGHPGEPACH